MSDWFNPRDKRTIYIGFDPREIDAFIVARQTFTRMANPIPVKGLVLSDLQRAGLYDRPMHRDEHGRLIDEISDHPMSTEFAISRFIVPFLVKTGWVLFADCDMMARGNLMHLMEWVARTHDDKAVVCVKHDHVPDNIYKMDGQVQSRYARKNWSSFMLINCDHPANRPLMTSERLYTSRGTLSDIARPVLVNKLPGRDLHRFCWLEDYGNSDKLIGELDPGWNYLVGHTTGVRHVNNVHWTDGVPSMKGYENAEYADEWRAELMRWAR